MVRVLSRLSCVLVALGACAGDDVPAVAIEPMGPPEVVIEDVLRHAEQFDQDLPQRSPGSQQEFAAATYLLGHLQRAGYVVQLDYVPVKDLVRSTNVVAEPPREPPRVIVVVAYDGTGGGPALGAFLEVARAARVRTPDHAVGFVAMGAETADVSGGLLGSRRLARRLVDDDVHPTIVELDAIADGQRLTIRGDAVEGFVAATGVDVRAGKSTDIVWDRAGFDHVLLSGEPSEVCSLLLDYLDTSAG